MTRMPIAVVWLLLAALLGFTRSPETGGAQAGSETHLDVLKGLEGTWTAGGEGFSSTLTYDWALPGVLMRARNELRKGNGDLIGRYEGDYAWDAGRSRIVFWTVGGNGELHQGTVEARDGRLWHAASVSGGAIEGYRSVMEPVEDEWHYRAVFTPSASDQQVLAAKPLVYRRAPR